MTPPNPDESTADVAPRRLHGDPERIGPYRIRERIGEGGFGIVYAAEQTEPVRRRVALKVIKPGMDSKSVVSRFEAERQALAVMDHPGVAKVFDGGEVPDGQPGAGRPYFVMEYVAGEPITVFCDKHRLTVDQRCELFVKVCDAVQHAHMKGVVHRDLKPSNILVSYLDGKPVPKVIDFGIAKALNQRLSESTIFTERGQMIGTPEYMSPEQAEMGGLDIDTRADIYSLGVVLYELLTGSLPFESETLRRAAFLEVQRIIREVEPPKPSTRLLSLATSDAERASSASKARRADARSLGRVLRGDLDWIVLKCLEKDRTRRYAAATELADELERHLGGDVVEARPPSVTYRMSKFVKRHRAGLAMTAGFVAIIVVAGGVATVGWVRAIEARASEAERAAQLDASATRERDLRDFLLREIVAAPAQSGVDTTVIDATRAALGRIDDRLANDPKTRFLLRSNLAMALFNSGLDADALAVSLEADERVRKEMPEISEDDFSAELLFNRMTIAAAYSRSGQHAGARAVYDDLIPDAAALLSLSHPFTLAVRAASATNRQRMGEFRDALAEQEAVAIERARVEGSEGRGTVSSRLSVIYTRCVIHEADDAPPEARRALVAEARAAFDAAQNPAFSGGLEIVAATNLVHAMVVSQEPELWHEGESLANEWLEIIRERLGASSMYLSTMLAHRGRCRAMLGRPALGAEDLRESLKIIEERSRAADPTREECVIRGRWIEALIAAGDERGAIELERFRAIDPLARLGDTDPARAWMEPLLGGTN